ncbi:MFS family permease [Symbiobacterium terraclitae]|uniref:MFS family permease n=2 Tax=Symbiobacterium terraclitae TaxID=557451 RepID=A0ABS4JWY4_9FIRM|nr:MFS family permease [Symbiobacterium terraclitae]
MVVLAAMGVSHLGHALYQLVVPLWILQTTGSAGYVGALNAISIAVRLLVTPVAGTVADRADRRAVMASANLARALVLAALALAFWRGTNQIGILLGAGAALAVAGAFFAPAYAAAQASLVHPQDLTRALSLWQMLRDAITFAGPSVAGLVVAAIGHAGALAANGATYLVAAVCVLGVQLRWAPPPPKARRPFWRDFAGGLAPFTGSPVILRTVILGAGVNLAGSAFAVLLPVIAARELGLSPVLYGLSEVRLAYHVFYLLLCSVLVAVPIELQTLAAAIVIGAAGIGNLWVRALVGAVTAGLGALLYASPHRPTGHPSSSSSPSVRQSGQGSSR